MFNKNLDNINIVAKTLYIIFFIPSILLLIAGIYLFIIFRIEHNFLYSYMAMAFICYCFCLIGYLLYFHTKTGYLDISNRDYIQFPMVIMEKNKVYRKEYIKNFKLYYRDISFIRIKENNAIIHLKCSKTAIVPMIYIPDSFFMNKHIKNKKIIGKKYNVFIAITYFIYSILFPIGKVIFYCIYKDNYQEGSSKRKERI